MDISVANDMFKNFYKLDDVLIKFIGNAISDKDFNNLNNIIYPLFAQNVMFPDKLQININESTLSLQQNTIQFQYPNFNYKKHCVSTLSQALYYNFDFENCQKCVNEFCQSCINRWQCYTCRYTTGLQRIKEEKCRCPDGFYGTLQENYECILKCDQKCKSCDRQNDICTICQDPLKQIPDCKICIAGYKYIDIYSEQCQSFGIKVIKDKNDIFVLDNQKFYNTCEEYYFYLGDENFKNGYYYQENGNLMQCIYDTKKYGMEQNSAYQIILSRINNSIPFHTKSFDQMKLFEKSLDKKEMWIGLDNLFYRCNIDTKCELLAFGKFADDQDPINPAMVGLEYYYRQFQEFYIVDNTDYNIFVNKKNVKSNLIDIPNDQTNTGLNFNNSFKFTTQDEADSTLRNCSIKHESPNWYEQSLDCSKCFPFGKVLEKYTNPLLYTSNICQLGIRYKYREGLDGSGKYQGYSLLAENYLGLKNKCKGSVGKVSSRIPSEDCQCPQQYYDNYPYNLECQKCHNNCDICIGLNNCIKCKNPEHSLPFCNCVWGEEYDAINDTCIKLYNNLVQNDKGNYQLNTGKIFSTCLEYKQVLLKENWKDGFFEWLNNPEGVMYCIFDTTSNNSIFQNDDSNFPYQFIFYRNDNGLSFNHNWEKMKQPLTNGQEFFMGLEDLHKSCNINNKCEFLFLGQVFEDQIISSQQYFYSRTNDFYIDNEDNLYALHFDTQNIVGDGTNQYIMNHNGSKFQTKDKQRDIYTENQAEKFNAPNWFLEAGGHYGNPLGFTINDKDQNLLKNQDIKNCINIGIAGQFKDNSTIGVGCIFLERSAFAFRNICVGSSNQPSSRKTYNNCICPEGYYDDMKNFKQECQKCLEHCITCDNIDSCIDSKYKLIKNQQNKYEITIDELNTYTFTTCQEYYFYLGKTNSKNGYYEEFNNKINGYMYCIFNGYEYGVEQDVIELLFRKSDNSIDFNQPWEQMQKGFGNENEMFVGLDNMSSKCYQTNNCNLYILADTFGDNYRYYINQDYLINYKDKLSIEIDNFYINKNNEYEINMGSYTKTNYGKNPNHFLNDHNNMKFSTKDEDNDTRDNNLDSCVSQVKSPFWYYNCLQANPLANIYNSETDTNNIETYFNFRSCQEFGIQQITGVNCILVKQIMYGFTRNIKGSVGLESSRDQNTGLCLQGYFNSLPYKLECQKCSDYINYCELCENQNKCTQCQINLNRIEPLCECQDGYYQDEDDNNVCLKYSYILEDVQPNVDNIKTSQKKFTNCNEANHYLGNSYGYFKYQYNDVHLECGVKDISSFTNTDEFNQVFDVVLHRDNSLFDINKNWIDFKNGFKDSTDQFKGLQYIYDRCQHPGQCNLSMHGTRGTGFTYPVEQNNNNQINIFNNFYLSSVDKKYQFQYEKLDYTSGELEIAEFYLFIMKNKEFQATDYDPNNCIGNNDSSPFWLGKCHSCNLFAQQVPNGTTSISDSDQYSCCNYGYSIQTQSGQQKCVPLKQSYMAINIKGCKGSILQPSSRIFQKNCECPQGYYDYWPYKLECQSCNDLINNCLICTYKNKIKECQQCKNGFIKNENACVENKFYTMLDYDNNFRKYLKIYNLQDEQILYQTCEEYELLLGRQNILTIIDPELDIWFEVDNIFDKIYCSYSQVNFDGPKEIYTTILYQIYNIQYFFEDKTWEDLKGFQYLTDNNFYMGNEFLHTYCGKKGDCELLITGKMSEHEIFSTFDQNFAKKNVHLKFEDYYIESENNLYRQHFSQKITSNVVKSPRGIFLSNDAPFNTKQTKNDYTTGPGIANKSGPGWYSIQNVCNPFSKVLFGSSEEFRYDNIDILNMCDVGISTFHKKSSDSFDYNKSFFIQIEYKFRRKSNQPIVKFPCLSNQLNCRFCDKEGICIECQDSYILKNNVCEACELESSPNGYEWGKGGITYDTCEEYFQNYKNCFIDSPYEIENNRQPFIVCQSQFLDNNLVENDKVYQLLFSFQRQVDINNLSYEQLFQYQGQGFFWIGLDEMNINCPEQNSCELLITGEINQNQYFKDNYQIDKFYIKVENLSFKQFRDNYQIQLEGDVSSNLKINKNEILQLNGAKFQTIDNDNENECAKKHAAPFWYQDDENICTYQNPLAKIYQDSEILNSEEVNQRQCITMDYQVQQYTDSNEFLNQNCIYLNKVSYWFRRKCNPPYYKPSSRNFNDNCNCYPGFFSNDIHKIEVCQQCQSQCLTCESTDVNCTECQNQYTILPNCIQCKGQNRNQSNNCKCMIGFIEQKDNFDCIKSLSIDDKIDNCLQVVDDLPILTISEPENQIDYDKVIFNFDKNQADKYLGEDAWDSKKYFVYNERSGFKYEVMLFNSIQQDGSYIQEGYQILKRPYHQDGDKLFIFDASIFYFCDNCQENFELSEDKKQCECNIQECQQCEYFKESTCECIAQSDYIQCMIQKQKDSLLCKKGYGKILTNSQLIENKYECQLCETQCEQCEEKPSNCTSCKSDINTLPVPNCKCQEKQSNYRLLQYFKLDGENISLSYNCLNQYQLIMQCKIQQACLRCDTQTGKCLSCDPSQNRRLQDGQCVCEEYYDIPTDGSKICVQQNNFATQSVQQTKTVAQASIGISAVLMLVSPSAFVQMLDTLQMIQYTLYLNIEYPKILIQHFEFFDTFTLKFIPSFVPENQHYQQSPSGFHRHQFYAYFFENVGQPMVIGAFLAIMYFSVLMIRKIKKLKKNKFLDHLQFSLEGNLFYGGVLSSFYLVVIPLFLQLKVISFNGILEFLAFIICYMLLFFYMFFTLSILRITDQIIEYNKSNGIIKESDNMTYNKYNILYEQYIFDNDNKISTGFNFLICIHKLLFAFILVFLNENTVMCQFLLILLKIGNTIIYYLFGKFQNKRHLRIEIIIEILFFLIYTITLRFSMYESDVFSEKIAATCVIFLNITILIIEICSAIYESLLSLIAMFKSYRNRNKLKKLEKINTQQSIQIHPIDIE